MTILPPGKTRALQTTSTPQGIFNILAIDHRDSLRVLLNPDDPNGIPVTEVTELKLTVIEALASLATAVMLEPEYSAAQAIVSGALPGQVGFLAAVEAQGYFGSRQNTLLSGWSVAKAKRLGAGGIKLLILYRPDAGEATTHQEELARAVIADCARHDIPLFLEPLAYPLDPAMPKTSPEYTHQRRQLVIETVRRLGALGPDILKIQFPIDANHSMDEGLWREACQELNEVAPVPWALLSDGVPYEIFKKQVQIGCEAGGSGFMIGRALWREVISAPKSDRTAALTKFAIPRFKELTDIANSLGHGWQRKYQQPVIDNNWFRQY